MMNTGEKIDYMIQCLQVAKGEAMFLDEYDSKNWETDMRWLSMHRAPNKALIKDNLRNAARMGFQLCEWLLLHWRKRIPV